MDHKLNPRPRGVAHISNTPAKKTNPTQIIQKEEEKKGKGGGAGSRE